MSLSSIGLPAHPYPNLDPTHTNLFPKPPLIPTLSTLSSHLPLLTALIIGIIKMTSLYALLYLLTLNTLQTISPSPSTSTSRKRTSVIMFVLSIVIATDDAYKWEYGRFNLAVINVCTMGFMALVASGGNIELKKREGKDLQENNKFKQLNKIFSPLLLLTCITTIIHPPAPSTLLSFTKTLNRTNLLGNHNNPYTPTPKYCTNGYLKPGLFSSPNPTSPSSMISKSWQLNTPGLDYDSNPDRTLWLFTGDTRTLAPFVGNAGLLKDVNYTRTWVNVGVSGSTKLHSEGPSPYVAVDCVDRGEKDTVLILHGLNGGSNEDYVRDFVSGTSGEGFNVCVMIGRGLMGTPVVDGRMFNGARTGDVGIVAGRIKEVRGGRVIGVGYSMGGIVLANYIASSGPSCNLDGGISIGGGLDMNINVGFLRSKYLWQPFLANTLISQFYYRFKGLYKGKLTPEQEELAVRSVSVTDFDRSLVAPYNGFGSVEEYYKAMSAGEGWRGKDEPGRIGNVGKPLAVVNALDDPIVCEGTLLVPEEVVEANENVLYLLTKRGGHVGYPLGMVRGEGWRWMRETVVGFIKAVQEVGGQEKTED